MMKAAYSIWLFVALCLLAACALAERLARGPVASSALRPGDHDMSLEVDGAVRTWILHVPPAVSAGEPLPLLIVLHGGGGSGVTSRVGKDICRRQCLRSGSTG